MKFHILYCFFLLISCEGNDELNNPDPEPSNELGTFINDWTFSVYPRDEDNFSIAEFKLWQPNSDELNGVLVLSGHNNSNSLYLTEDANWRAFATTHKLAIAATYMVSSNTGYYGNAENGSGEALIAALNKIAIKNKINNFDELPYYLRGYSAGGVFSYSFSEFFPFKTAAVGDIRGGFESNNKHNVNNLNIPGLILVGEKELSRIERVKSIILNKRLNNGLWSYAIEPNALHSSNLMPSDNLVRMFFSKVLSFKSSNENINFTQGYLGNNFSKEFLPYSEYFSEKSEASWLIDESFAQSWQSYQ